MTNTERSSLPLTISRNELQKDLRIQQRQVCKLPSLTCSVSLIKPGLGSVLSEDRRKTYMEALWFHAVDARYSTIKAAHTRTCRWMLQRPEYQGWLDTNKFSYHHGLLWIKGKPGSGKSTLMKFIVANAQKMKGEVVIISFFFNARGEDLEKSTLGMYRSLLYQLFKALPDLQTILNNFESRFPQDGGSCTLEEEDLKRIFIAAIQNLKQYRLICFIDALDECDEDEIRDLVIFLENLGQLAISSQIRFNVCLSSRHYPYIYIKMGVQLILEGQDDHVQDIAKYLNSELRAGNGKQFEAIKEEILTRASGIFLWVALVVQILNREYDHGRVHALWRRLREIPDGLDKLFEDILTRDRENTKELILCLQWILYAKRPLKREELYYAILSGTDHEMLSVSDPDGITVQDMERFILSCSKGLAETTRLKAQTVQFIHESVRDFLLGKTGINKLKLELEARQSQERLKQCCCSYMKADVSNYLPPSGALPVASTAEAGDLRRLVSEKFPFLEYAVRNVLFHADIADGHGISQEDFVENFALGNWIMLDNLFERYQVRRHTINASLLYICAEKSLSNLIRTLLKRDPYPETAGERFENERYAAPLYAALANAKVSEDTVRALLTPAQTPDFDQDLLHAYPDCDFECLQAAIRTLIKCRPNLNPYKDQSLFRWAASEGHEAILKILLAKGDIRLDLKDKHGWTPLFRAVIDGHNTAVKLLLAKNGIDLNFKDDRGRTALSLATSEGHDTIVKLLFAEDNIDVNVEDDDGYTPLMNAAINGHDAVVKLLLARQDIDLNFKDNKNRTALSWAALSGHDAVVKSLLARQDIDLNFKINNGLTPLLNAALSGRDTTVQLLLTRQDIDLNFKDYDNRSALSFAALYGYNAVVKSLLSRQDIDLNFKDNNGQTPLLSAASNGHDTVVKLLLARQDIDSNFKDNKGRTALSMAALNWHGKMIESLLAHDNVIPDSRDDFGQTPLFLALCQGYERPLEVRKPAANDGSHSHALLDYQAQLMLLEQQNKRRLLLARREREKISMLEAVEKLLKNKDIDLNLKDNNGQTVLLWAASDGHEEVVKLLLANRNVNPNLSDNGARTPLWWATLNGHESVIKLLLARHDVDPNSRDDCGETPLSLATSIGHDAVVKLLLARDDIDAGITDKSGQIVEGDTKWV